MVLREWARDTPAEVGAVRAALTHVTDDPAALDDDEWSALLGAQGAELDELTALADATRREVIGADTLTFVANRNFDTAVIRRDDVDVEALVVEAGDLGATEICMQGPLPPEGPGEEYLRLIEQITTAGPGLHLHAYRPPEVLDAARRLGVPVEEFLARARARGLASVPGTAAQILDEQIRAYLSPTGSAPVGDWTAPIEAAHSVGLFSTATLLYGHVERPEQVVAHLRLLNAIQDRTGGFSELILMPMVETNTPPHRRDVARGQASRRETRAVHAVARLLTRGHFDHLQVAWTKLDAATVDDVLAGGVDDIGGMLIDGTLLPEAGAEAGRVLQRAQLTEIAERAGRVLVQRTTAYDPVVVA